LRRNLAAAIRCDAAKLFAHRYCQFGIATRAGATFSVCALANYPQNVRIAALNLGAKVIELAWTEKLLKAFPTRPALTFKAN
jgi:hypothetical protein